MSSFHAYGFVPTYNEAANKELVKEQIPKSLVWRRETAQDVCWTTKVYCSLSFRDRLCSVSSYLLMVLPHQHKACHKTSENLREDVVRDLLPWKALPECKAERYSWKVSASATEPGLHYLPGLKWPPDVGAQVMIANAIPMAYAQPIAKSDPNWGSVPFKKNAAVAAIPG